MPLHSDLLKRDRFAFIGVRLTLVMLFLSIVPAVTVGWVSSKLLIEKIGADRIREVGIIADDKHAHLIRVLTRANDRAKLFLSNLADQCNPTKLNRACASKLMNSYLSSENVLGITLHGRGGELLTAGTQAVNQSRDTTFKAGQLAKFAGTCQTACNTFQIRGGNSVQ